MYHHIETVLSNLHCYYDETKQLDHDSQIFREGTLIVEPR